jgi:beta-glucosidase
MFQKKQGGSIGIVISTKWFEPMTDTKIDQAATERALAFENAW